MIKKIGTIINGNKEKVFGVMAIILIILFAISVSPKTLQNDTFYTISIGKSIEENGIDFKDHFSWHELSYKYPHWLYDFGMYQIYNLGGWDAIYISTCVFAAILGICIYKTNANLTKNKIISFIVTIAVLYLLKGYIAARAQLVTFILFILLIFNIEKFLQNKKVKNAIALLFIQTLIANLHVAVWPFTLILYLPYIGEYLVCELIDIALYRKAQLLVLNRKLKRIDKKIKISKSDKITQKLNIKLQNTSKKIEDILQRQEKISIKRKEDEGKSYKIVLKKNKNTRWLILIMIISLFTGLLTPLGKTPYTYTYLTMIGDTMNNINEHLPLVLANNTQIICTLIVILALLTFTDSKIKLADLFMLGGLMYLMFASRRQQSIFILIGSIGFTRIVTDFFQRHIDYPVEDYVNKLFNKFTGFILITVILILSLHSYKGIKGNSYINERAYPVEASNWILNNLDVKNIKIYNEYNYGSYLLYRGIPVFIDSRADLYAPEFNTPTGNKSDGENIFGDFMNISNIGKYYGELFEKYGITHAIMYKNSKVNLIIQKADSEKYKELYSDDNFVIYEVLDY